MNMLKLARAFLVTILAVFASQMVLADSHESLPRSDAPEGAEVYIISPKDGETVAKKFTVKFGLIGMGVAPAGIEKTHTGHHHLLIDGEINNMNAPIGANAMHFGGGQTETEIILEPGSHTLQLILADHMHIPHNPPLTSELITITVK